jgi:hypothetical protein
MSSGNPGEFYQVVTDLSLRMPSSVWSMSHRNPGFFAILQGINLAANFPVGYTAARRCFRRILASRFPCIPAVLAFLLYGDSGVSKGRWFGGFACRFISAPPTVTDEDQTHGEACHTCFQHVCIHFTY